MRSISLFNRSVKLEWILLFIIVIVGIILRIVTQNHIRYNSYDAVAFQEVSIGSEYAVGGFPFNRRGSLFQLLIIVSHSIFGASFESSVLVPQFFGSIIPIIMFLLGKHFFDSKTGLVAALLVSLNPMFINLSCWILRETMSLALILIFIFAAHFTLEIEPKKRSLKATILLGFLSGLIILTREEMMFVIPPAYIIYIFLNEKNRRDSIIRSCIFLITIILTITPWLYYSSLQYGDPFYSYAYYIKFIPGMGGGTSGTGATSEVLVFQRLAERIGLGLWNEINAFPAILSLFGIVLLPLGIILTIRKRPVWIVFLIVGIDLIVFSPFASTVTYELMLFPYHWADVDRILFSAVMPANLIVAYGIKRLASFLLYKGR